MGWGEDLTSVHIKILFSQSKSHLWETERHIIVGDLREQFCPVCEQRELSEERDDSYEGQQYNMKKVRRMMSKEIQRNNSFAAFSAKESGSVNFRSRTKSADTFEFGTTKNQTSILMQNWKEETIALIQLTSQIQLTFHPERHL